MIENIFQGILGVVAVLAFLYVWGDIAQRIPPKFEIKTGGFPTKRFGAWVELVDYSIDEYRVGHVDQWEIGYNLKTVSDGQVELGDTEGKKRVYISFYAFRDAYKKSNVIGWAEDKGDSVNVHLSLAPEQTRDILTELRQRHSKISMHVHGWVDEKNIKIEYFSLSPSYEGMSE